MWFKLFDYFKVIIFSSVKFIGGPIYGVFDHHLSLLETIVFTIVGMMISVVLVTFFGEFIKEKFYSNSETKVKVTKKKRNIVKVWNKHGVKGVAFLTPLIFTPIGGTVIAVSFGAKRREIFTYMLISAIIWSTILSSLLFLFEDLIRKSGLI